MNRADKRLPDEWVIKIGDMSRPLDHLLSRWASAYMRNLARRGMFCSQLQAHPGFVNVQDCARWFCAFVESVEMRPVQNLWPWY